MHIDRVAAAAHNLALLIQGSLLVDVDRSRVEIIQARGHHHTFRVFPRSGADAVARIYTRGTNKLSVLRCICSLSRDELF
jgi:hypothetical protein